MKKYLSIAERLKKLRGDLSQKNFALYGASRNKNKFGSYILRDLKLKGYKLFPIHPNADVLENEKCYKSIHNIPFPIDGVIISIPPSQTEKIIDDLIDAGIKKVWMQQGSESNDAIKLCADNGINVISKECIFMFAKPAEFFHKAHRWVWGIFGKLPH